MSRITRDTIISRLGDVPYDRFLLYLMGPYKSFNLADVLSEDDRANLDVEELPGPLRRLFKNEDRIDDAYAQLRRVQGQLRTTPGVNAFLAVDIDVDTEEIDAVTQSVQYSQRSNATTFVVPYLGHNFGVGEEAGTILENVADTQNERILFMHGDDVTSEMIRSARTRWDLRIESYGDEEELVTTIRRFVVTIMNQERFGELDYRR